jgi:hypothetical protein
LESPEGRIHSQNQGVDRKIILKWNSRRNGGGCGLDDVALHRN